MTVASDTEPLGLEMQDISMRFGDVWVLNDVNIRVGPGAIHAIVGHNGAGKSTLMKIALGVYRPTRGEVRIAGQPLSYAKPAGARDLGLGMVFQERSLIPTLNGLDNLFLNSERTTFGMVRRRDEVAEAQALLDQLGIPRILLDITVAEMSTIEQELLEIAKALRLSDKVLVLDEPTAPLGRAEIQRLFQFIRGVASRGTGIVLITHHLAEVFAISDHVTCLREGRVVLSTSTRDTSMAQLIRAMLGRSSVVSDGDETKSEEAARPVQERPEGLSVRHMKVGEKLTDVTFDVHRGEIVGIAGVVGSGRSTLLRTLFGDIHPDAGEISWRGRPYPVHSPGDAIGAGIFLIPEDRARHGVILTKSIVENDILPILDRFVNRLRILNMSEARGLSHDLMRQLDLRARSIDQVVGELSGGNQQKVVLSKALAVGATLLLLDEPTFGVDIGAVREIVHQVQQVAAAGTAVLWATSDLREMLEVADRVVVLRDGVIESTIPRGDPDFDEDVITARMQRIQYIELAQAAAGESM